MNFLPGNATCASALASLRGRLLELVCVVLTWSESTPNLSVFFSLLHGPVGTTQCGGVCVTSGSTLNSSLLLLFFHIGNIFDQSNDF